MNVCVVCLFFPTSKTIDSVTVEQLCCKIVYLGKLLSD